jgi:hypothetical protein
VVAAAPFDKLGAPSPYTRIVLEDVHNSMFIKDADHDCSIALRTPPAQSRLGRTRELRVLSPVLLHAARNIYSNHAEDRRLDIGPCVPLKRLQQGTRQLSCLVTCG